MNEATPVHKNNSNSAGRNSGHKGDGQKRHGKFKINKMRLILASVGAILLFALISLGCLLIYKSNTNSSIDSSRYQAVFLSNGQVYFGKLHTYNSEYMKLNDIYYLQTKTTQDTSSNPQETSTSDQSNVQLIKLGSEIHGPDDEMIVSKNQILFFENLSKDSQVTKSIAKYKTPS
ncbi:hypothetical protein CVV43_00105 [Candidatus Saccharibacteria bacterium HGW-Saccharibacteria-1]|jgi:hypothetical protein|nr:MAG: hypothetical protein CVV43_00105 [Candidatus Saccharibacteria bacterium HGW-Saccharibacteria-1]